MSECVCQRLSLRNFASEAFSGASFQPKKRSSSFHLPHPHPPPSSPLISSASRYTNLLYAVWDIFIFDTQGISKRFLATKT